MKRIFGAPSLWVGGVGGALAGLSLSAAVGEALTFFLFSGTTLGCFFSLKLKCIKNKKSYKEILSKRKAKATTIAKRRKTAAGKPKKKGKEKLIPKSKGKGKKGIEPNI